MNGVIYARYSSDNQREESIDGQVRECLAYAEKNGIQIVETYIDRAMTAKTDKRPDFQRMIKDSYKKGFDVVLVWKLDRFARNRFDSAKYKMILRQNEVRVLSATEAISSRPEGILMESMLEGWAEYYSAELAEKVIRGQTENALKCKSNGGTLPFGYYVDDEQHFQINLDTAPFVCVAFQMYDEGYTMKEIAADFKRRGIKNTRGTDFTINTISNLLSNRRYIGEYKYRDIVIPDGIPAIVDKDLFDRVQQQIEKNKKAKTRKRLPDTRQTRIIFSQQNSIAANVCRSWWEKAVPAAMRPLTAITSASPPSAKRAAIRKRSKRIGLRKSLSIRLRRSFLMMI